MSIKLIAADAHPIYLLGLKQLFSTQSNLELLACCSSAEKVHAALSRQQPDILLLDLHLEGSDGMQLVRDLKNQGSELKIIILTKELDNEQTMDALRLDVQGMVLKSMPMHLLIQCIQKVAAGGQWLEKNSLGQAFEKMLLREAGMRRLSTILTDRETEVMCLVAQGFTNRKIAEKLILSEGTVKIHVHNIYGKLGIKNRVDLTLYAQKRGMV